MLIVLSGVDTLPLQLIARQITAAMYNTSVDGYSVSFQHDGTPVVKLDDTIVYKAVSESGDHGIDTIHRFEGGLEAMSEIDLLSDNLNKEFDRQTHFRNSYVDLSADYGIEDTEAELSQWDGEEEGIHRYSTDVPSISDIVDAYQDSPLDVQVITGCFSKAFINELKAELDDLLVVNVTRNPSVACALMVLDRDENDFKDTDAYLTQIRLIDSILTTHLLSQEEDVVTISFEDVLAAGGLEVNGLFVELPHTVVSFNGYITTFELDHMPPLNANSLQRWNKKLSSFDIVTLMSEIEPFDVSDDPQLIALSKLVPKDLFKALNYKPLEPGLIVT